MQKRINVSVRDIADFSLASGDIETYAAFGYREAALDGTQNHIRFQKDMIKQYGEDCFAKEVYVEDVLENDVVYMVITGRIDGVLKTDDSNIFVYEIKTTCKDINEIKPADRPEHLGQAHCYAYMYCKKNNIDATGIRLVYINRENQDSITFEYRLTFKQLESIYSELSNRYLDWVTGITAWKTIRNQSIETLEFPFASYRAGQKTLMSEVYNCIDDAVKLFATAPTGIGKTMGVLFPAIKALGAGLVDKLMYLTAKTVTAKVAVDAYKKLEKNGLNLRTVCITAKDKVCPMDKKDCDPEKCPRANHYYIRARACLKEILHEQFFDRDIITRYADEYNICPFELSLDVSGYCDLIICDYNYLFDPRVRLQRYFDYENEQSFCFMVDEAHNLVERGREMFSCSIGIKQLEDFKDSIKKEWKALRKSVNALINEMKELQAEHFSTMNQGFISQAELPLVLTDRANRCVNDIMMYDLSKIPDDKRESFLEGMFNILFFSRVAQMYDRRFTTLFTSDGKGLDVKLMCLDPSYLLRQSMDTGRSAILFSATLEPKRYYMDLLGGDGNMDSFLTLDSPFPRENLKVKLVTDISTKYKDRDLSYEKIAQLLKKQFSQKTGNYMVFFPSYAYMRRVVEIFTDLCPDMDILEQKPYMDDAERSLFLERFEKFGENTLVAFAVMGGLFGEGIDLVGEMLSGVAIIGPGLPMLCPERELIKKYFDDIDMNGFDYSYTFPGMNRVLQAAGRVIRSETDTGFVLLIDSRFGTAKYRSLFPKWWNCSNMYNSFEEDGFLC